MTINLTDIICALITLLAAIVSYKLIPWIKSKTTETQQSNLRALVKVLVFAAEQLYGAGHGHDKLEYVRRKLLEHGFDVDVAEIEAAVAEYLNYWRVTSVHQEALDEIEDNGGMITPKVPPNEVEA